MAKLNNTKKSGKNVADDKERLASEIAARYDPNSATYKYRDKTPYQSLREKNEISTIPRTYESQRYSRSTPEGSAYRQNQSPTLTTEDYRNAANAYVTNSRRQRPQPPQSRNPRSSYYNPNWQKELTERRQAEKASIQMGKDKLAAERKQRLQERTDKATATMREAINAADFDQYVRLGKSKAAEAESKFNATFRSPQDAAIRRGEAYSNRAMSATEMLDWMGDYEKGTYYYLLGKDEAKANAFLDLLGDSLNARRGQHLSAYMDSRGLIGKAGSALAGGLSSAASGMSNAASAVFNGEARPTTSNEYASQIVRENIDSKVGRALYDVGYTGANMLPSIGVSLLASGLGAAPKIASLLGSSTLGISAGGNAYKGGRDMGYTHGQSLAYGALVGASEAGLQAVLGGISNLGLGITEEAAGGAISRALGKVIKNTGVTDAIGRYIANMGSEATEEYLQSLLEPVFKNVVAGEQNEFNPLDEEALYSGLMGALTAGLFESPRLALNVRGAILAEREFNAALNSMQQENTAVQEQSPVDIQRKAAKGVAGNEVEPSAAANRTPANEDINRVTEAAAKAAQTQPPTNIQEAAAQAAENAAQSPLERQASNNAAAPAKTAQNGVATRHTATTSNGNAVSVGSIVDTDNGLNVRLSDGTTAQLSDVDFDDPNINVLYERAASFDADTANALVNNYTGETSVDNYLRGFNSVYLSGKQGYEYAKAVGDSVYARHYLNDNARMAAFRAGQAAYQSSRANSIAGQQGNNVRPQAKAEYEAGVNREYSDRKLTSSQRKQIRALDEVFKAAGKKLVIHDAIGTDGNSVTFSRSDANAYYDAKTDTYHLSLDSTGQAYAYVVAHESIHEMEVKNKEGFSALSEVVEAAIEGELMNQKGMTFDEAKAEFEKMVQYQIDKNGLSRSEAVTEVVANTVPVILTDEQQGKRFADKVMKSSGKVRAWFEQLIKDLRAILDKAYNILKGQKSWEQMELIRNNKQTLDMIADYYFEGMEGTKGKASNTEKTDGNVKRSAKDINADIREVNPMEITPPNRVTSSSKYHYLINEFENNGYNGRNVVLVENGNDGYQALTGSHRILAAREAGVDVPSVVIPMSEEIQPLLDATGDEERARIADELYEDGIIPKEARDLLVREDELNFENLGKPLDKQVRFSRKDDVSVTPEDAKKLQKQNDKLKQALEVAKQEIKLSDGHHVKASAVERLAGSLLKEYSSKMDKAELVSNITELFDYIGNGENVVWDEVQAGAMNIALNVLDQSSKRNTEWYDNTKPAREFLKNNTIKLNEKQLAEVQSAFGSYTEFRRELYNKAKFSKTEGISLEQAWRDLSGMFPDTFDPDTPDVDMPTLLHDEVLNMYDRPIENPYGYGMKEYAADLAMRLYGEYMALPERKTFADKQQKKLEMQRARYNTLMEQQREQAKAKYEKLRDQRDITKYKTSIEKNAKSLYSWLTKPNNSKHVPEALRNKTAALLKTLEFDGKKGYMWKDAMRNLQTWMQQVDRAKTNPDIDNPLIEYAPDLIDNMQSLLDSASKYNNISEMPLDKLKELNNIVAAVKHTVTTANTVIADGRRQYIDDIGGNIIKTAQVQRPKAREFMRKHPYAYKMASAVSGFFNSGNVKPIYFFDNIGGEMKTLFNDVRQASYKAALTANAIREEYAQIKDKYHYKEWADKSGDLLTIQTKGGSNVSITREQALDIYATAKREKLIGTQHLTKDGFVFNKDIVQKNGKLIETATNDNVNKPLSEETIAEISDWLTKEQKGYADALVELMSTKGAELGNEVTMQMYGINRFAESYYIPIMSAQQFIETAFNGRVPEAMSWMNKGFTKNTVAGARNPIVITGITQKALQHMADMATYNAMAIPQDTMAKVYNYKQRGEDGGANTYIRAELDKAYGQHTSKYIKTFINDISGNITVDPRDSMASKMISAFRRNAVAGKLSVAIQQPSAIVRATALVDPKYFFGHVDKNTYDTAKKYSGTAVIKEVGGFDAYTGKGLVQWMTDNDKPNFRNVRDAVAGWLPQKMDEITWCRIWKACENEVADTTALERGSEEFYKAVGHRFDDVIEYTQVYDSVISRSEYMRSKSAGAKLFTSFKAEPTVSYNMYWYALKHMDEKGGKARLLRTAASIIGAGVFNAMLKSVITAIRDDDENQNYVDKYVEALAGNLVGTPLKKVPYIGEHIYLGGELDTLGSLPLVNEVLSMLQGYTSSRSELKVIQDLINAAGDLDNEKKGLDERLLRMAKATSQMFGIPLDAFIKDWLGVVREAYKAISGNEPELSGNILYEIREGLGVKQELELYKGVDKAITTGDYTRLDKQFKTMVERDTTTDPTKKARETVRAAVRQYFDAGEVKAGDAKRILVRCGYKMDDAEAMITKWDFWRDYPEAHDTSIEDGTETLAAKYFEYAKPANIDKTLFYDVYKFNGSAKADKDKNGNSIRNSKRDKVADYINKQRLTKAQKDALWLACGYKGSTLDEAPWR